MTSVLYISTNGARSRADPPYCVSAKAFQALSHPGELSEYGVPAWMPIATDSRGAAAIPIPTKRSFLPGISPDAGTWIPRAEHGLQTMPRYSAISTLAARSLVAAGWPMSIHSALALQPPSRSSAATTALSMPPLRSTVQGSPPTTTVMRMPPMPAQQARFTTCPFPRSTSGPPRAAALRSGTSVAGLSPSQGDPHPGVPTTSVSANARGVPMWMRAMGQAGLSGGGLGR